MCRATGRPSFSLSRLAQERHVVDKAYAGGLIIGVFDRRVFSISDTILPCSKKFAREYPDLRSGIFARVRQVDSMKGKQL